MDPNGSPIEPYEEDTFRGSSESEKEEWAQTVYRQMEENGLITDGNRFVFHTGREYYDLLGPLLEDAGIETELPTKGLRLGQMLA